MLVEAEHGMQQGLASESDFTCLSSTTGTYSVGPLNAFMAMPPSWTPSSFS